MRGKLFYKDSTELLSVSYSQLLQDIKETDFLSLSVKVIHSMIYLGVS